MDVLKAISDDNRYKILELLLSKKYCVKALAKKLEISEPAVSQHLKVLKQAGLVKGKKEGYYMHYSVEKSRLKILIDDLNKLYNLQSISCDKEHKCCGGDSHEV